MSGCSRLGQIGRRLAHFGPRWEASLRHDGRRPSCHHQGFLVDTPLFNQPFRRLGNAAIGRDLSGKTAIITGSTSGIGLGVAEKLAERGCDVILNGFGDREVVESLQENIRKHDVKCYFDDADLSHVDEITRMCDRVASEFPGGVDILVNNAGLQHVCEVESFPVEKWDLLLSVMLSAPFHFTRLLLPTMRSKGWGRIINISSVHGLRASLNKSAYCSAKHGVIGLTKVVALETAGSGVTCNAICPGFVDTPIYRSQIQTLAQNDNISLSEAQRRFLARVHPSEEVVAVFQIAGLVEFLCTSSADQMTGATLTMDGGWTAR